jgi:transcriptional regulator with XRE-family HTH domain
VFGKRLRHYRKVRGLTLQQLGDRVGKQASFLSMLEGGKREPRPPLVDQLAQALDVSGADLLRADPPDKRSRLEVAVERIQDEPLYQRLHLPPLKIAAGIPDAALEHVLALHRIEGRLRPPPPRFRRPAWSTSPCGRGAGPGQLLPLRSSR